MNMDENSILEILKEQKQMNLKGNLYHITQIQFAYNSNHIEGNTLNEEETRLMYETKSVISNGTSHKIDDLVEMQNHFTLFNYMLSKAEKDVSEELIKEFHKILKSSTTANQKEWFKVGEYKSLPNEVGGKQTIKPENVEFEIQKLLKWYNSIHDKKLEDIVEFHYEFESIHPFQDGNGRVGRMIMFKECLKNNVIPFIVLDEYKAFYYRGLKEYEMEKGYLLDTCLSMQDKYKELIDRLLK